jgi:hypothetical protein
MKILLLALPTTLDHLVPMFESEGHDVRLLTTGPENMSLYVSECYNYIIEQISEFEPDHIVNAVVNLHFELGIDTYPWIFNVLQNTPESAALEHNRYNARTLAREHGGFELAPLLIEQTGDLLSLPINESQEQFVKPRNFLDECIVVPPNTEFSLQYDSYVEADVDPDVEAWCFFTMCGDKYSIIRTIASTGAKENKTLGSGTSFPEGVTLIDLTDEQETLFLEKCNAWLNYAKTLGGHYEGCIGGLIKDDRVFWCEQNSRPGINNIGMIPSTAENWLEGLKSDPTLSVNPLTATEIREHAEWG